jgi:hypothetical protein
MHMSTYIYIYIYIYMYLCIHTYIDSIKFLENLLGWNRCSLKFVNGFPDFCDYYPLKKYKVYDRKIQNMWILLHAIYSHLPTSSLGHRRSHGC